MSFNVLVIPEDFRKDQHILKPVVKSLLRAVGLPNAKVQVCQNPLLGGTGQALNKNRILEVVRKYGMVDLFLLCVDRDGEAGRRHSLDAIEQHIATYSGKPFLAENAWQEVEVWVLAGMGDLPSDWAWSAVRAEVSLKEQFYAPYAAMRGVDSLPDEGRKLLGKEAASNYTRLRSRCPEDVQSLEQRIQNGCC